MRQTPVDYLKAHLINMILKIIEKLTKFRISVKDFKMVILLRLSDLSDNII